MLILTRRIGEGNPTQPLQVSIVVEGAKGGRVNLEIAAPKESPVNRNDLFCRDQPQSRTRLDELPIEGIRVLLTDTDLSLASQYSTHLSGLGYQVTTATDGLACVNLLRSVKPQAIVLDAGMLWGRAEGVMAMLEEHAELSEVSVLVTFKNTDRETLAALRWFRICNYIAKPVTPPQLAAHVREVLPFHAQDQDT